MNTYKIVVLGPSGSGKTVFLASMFNKLSIQRPDTSFFLEADHPEQRKILNQKYDQVAGPGDWPPGTQYQEVSEWHFTCHIQPAGGHIYPALQFTYLDYAGGRLTDPKESAIPDSLEQKIREADALLGILDGQKILALMKGGPAGERFINIELQNVLQIMQRSESPIHFVITKWDILQGKYKLFEVRKRLQEFDGFRFLVENRIQRCSVRLIPVSAVGFGFAQLQPDGSMKKTGAYPRPFQVESPLACVLPDKFAAEIKKLIEQERLLSSPVTKKPQYTIWDDVRLLAGGALRNLRRFLARGYQFDEHTFEGLVRFIEAPVHAKEYNAVQEAEKLRLGREASLREVKDEQTALAHAVDSFEYIVRKLEADFPESDLSKSKEGSLP